MSLFQNGGYLNSDESRGKLSSNISPVKKVLVFKIIKRADNKNIQDGRDRAQIDGNSDCELD